MNAERRKAIGKAVDLLSQALEAIEAARDEEQDYYDNMPESILAGAKGDTAQEAVSALDDAATAIQEAIDRAESAGEPV